jgi:REP element-mobilizing transposase RayT
VPIDPLRAERHTRGESHVPPEWVDQAGLFFITINCAQRGLSQLTHNDVSAKIFESITFYHSSRRWWPEIVLLMPDHLHALIRFSWSSKNGMNSVIAAWKRYTARQLGIVWQRDYFDHRIRSDADYSDKWQYIQNNPVRKNLVENFQDWPHVWRPRGVGWMHDVEQ